MLNYTYLILGVLYVTLLPGFVFVEYLLPKVSFWKKLPIYFVASIIISTIFSYFTSILFGFNRNALLFDVLLFMFLAIPKIGNIKPNQKVFRSYMPVLLTMIVVYVVFFVPLFAGIFKYHEGYYVMSGPNWQDTAMHQSIIESLSEGNFPPVAPYFSGEKLSYYYFADFHSAIVNRLYGNFFPWIIVVLNPYFASIFFVAVYSLTFSLTKNKLASIFSGLGSVFYGNLGFINLVKDVYLNNGGYLSLLTNNAYHIDIEAGLQMVPMADYFLQNRPMMIGLPVVVTITFLLVESTKSKYGLKLLLIAGLLNASLVKFQFFGLVIGGIYFGGYLLHHMFIVKAGFKDFVSRLSLFTLPSILVVLVSSFGKAGERSLLQVVIDTFSWGPWQDQNAFWFSNFILLNFNVSILLFFFSVLFLMFNYKQHSKVLLHLVFPSVFIFIVPFVLNFTIYNYDMFKFFYYFIPFVYAIIFYCFFVAIKQTSLKQTLLKIFFLIVLTITSWTSVNMLIHAYLNKTQGYSKGQYLVGVWLRKNTPQKSVFLTSPTVHSPVSDIAGRLRILSYINWPYSHGFNTGVDNVFSRLDDTKRFFDASNSQSVKNEILDKYEIKYIYIGEEERSDFPNAQNELESNSSLNKIYDQDNIQIFERVE